MKLELVALFSAQVLAQKSGIPMILDIEERKLSHVVKMVATQITTSYSAKNLGKMLQGYGCYCYKN
jgi:hypothetical protein